METALFLEKKKRFHFHLSFCSANLNFLLDIQSVISKFCNIHTKTIHCQRACYALCYGGNNNLRKIRKFLYKGATAFLNHKHTHFSMLGFAKLSSLDQVDPKTKQRIIKDYSLLGLKAKQIAKKYPITKKNIIQIIAESPQRYSKTRNSRIIQKVLSLHNLYPASEIAQQLQIGQGIVEIILKNQKVKHVTALQRTMNRIDLNLFRKVAISSSRKQLAKTFELSRRATEIIVNILGLPKRPCPEPFDIALIPSILQDYNDGLTWQQLSDKYSRSISFLWKHIKPLITKSARQPHKAWSKEELQSLYLDIKNHTPKEVLISKYNRSWISIYHCIQHNWKSAAAIHGLRRYDFPTLAKTEL